MMWKTRWGRCIYTSSSGFQVYQNPRYRWLTMGSTALQTVIKRNRPETPILYYLPALTLMRRIIPGDSCLLGLGGASIAHMLHEDKSKHTLTAIDNSLEIIHIAKEFFVADSLPELRILHDDALHFVSNTQEQFLHFMIDLYHADRFPDECAQDNFFIQCKNRLRPNGFLSINLANPKDHVKIFNLMRRHFKQTLVIPIKKSANIVIIAWDTQERILDNLRLSREIKKIIWMDFWCWVGMMK